MPENENTETVETTGTEATFTKAQVETMIADATKKANGEAAGFRHKLAEIDEKDNANKIKNSEDLEELRGMLAKKDTEYADLTGKLEGLNGKLETYQQRDVAELEALLPSVPEAFKGIVSDEALTIEKRLELAKAHATTKNHPPGYRGAGEPPPTNLLTQYEAAVKSGNVAEQMRLKREMHEAKE